MSYNDRRFWISYISFIIIIGGILVPFIYIYITRLASKEIYSPSNKIHREVGRAKDLRAPRYILYNDGCDDYYKRQSKVSFCTVTAKHSSAASSKKRNKTVSVTSYSGRAPKPGPPEYEVALPATLVNSKINPLSLRVVFVVWNSVSDALQYVRLAVYVLALIKE
jgi:hypothetical protein